MIGFIFKGYDNYFLFTRLLLLILLKYWKSGNFSLHTFIVPFRSILIPKTVYNVENLNFYSSRKSVIKKK